MRHLFYRFSDESSYYRYFHSVRSMPHAKCRIRQCGLEPDLSIVGLVGEEGKGRIIAEGRYLGIPAACWPSWSSWWMRIINRSE